MAYMIRAKDSVIAPQVNRRDIRDAHTIEVISLLSVIAAVAVLALLIVWSQIVKRR